MPLYDITCPECGHVEEHLAKHSEIAEAVFPCPKCDTPTSHSGAPQLNAPRDFLKPAYKFRLGSSRSPNTQDVVRKRDGT